jgi:hypothetical protein
MKRRLKVQRFAKVKCITFAISRAKINLSEILIDMLIEGRHQIAIAADKKSVWSNTDEISLHRNT